MRLPVGPSEYNNYKIVVGSMLIHEQATSIFVVPRLFMAVDIRLSMTISLTLDKSWPTGNNFLMGQLSQR